MANYSGSVADVVNRWHFKIVPGDPDGWPPPMVFVSSNIQMLWERAGKELKRGNKLVEALDTETFPQILLENQLENQREEWMDELTDEALRRSRQKSPSEVH